MFEERRWIIGNGLRSPESPSGHLPACPAQQHLPRTLPEAEPPMLLITLQTMLRRQDPVYRERKCIAPTGKQSSPCYTGLGKACRAIPSLLTPGTSGDLCAERGDEDVLPALAPYSPWPGAVALPEGSQPRALPGTSRCSCAAHPRGVGATCLWCGCAKHEAAAVVPSFAGRQRGLGGHLLPAMLPSVPSHSAGPFPSPPGMVPPAPPQCPSRTSPLPPAKPASPMETGGDPEMARRGEKLSHRAGFTAPPGDGVGELFSGVSHSCLRPTQQHLIPMGG